MIQKKIIRRTVETILQVDGLHPVLSRIYAARGVTTANELEYNFKQLLHYRDLRNIESATALLAHAVQQQHTIVIVGDFDADGATSSALAVSALKAMGAQQVQFIVPNRFEFGYGLTPEIVAVAAKLQPQLIITVDNGIANHEGVASANALGIKVLITDHHLAGASLPNAAAILNPNQPDDTFASKNLAGVGVVFYLLLSLRSYLREQQWFTQKNISEPNLAQWLDLVALGTIADVVPLDHNNRILVQQGLQRIRAGLCRPGILALLEIANRQPKNLTATDLAFSVAPRLNAAGRLDDMSLGVACLLTDNIVQARQLAAQLDALNQERRHIETNMQQQALQALDHWQRQQTQTVMPLGLCLYDDAWHQGVIGILAARIKDKYQRPVIAFALADEHTLKGSARSVTGVHIRDVLANIANQHPQLLTKFGGHAMAAGLTLPRANYAQFAELFAAETALWLSAEQAAQHHLYSDGELSIDDLTLELALALQAAGPFGQKFPEPLFDGQFKILDQRLLQNKHLKLIVQPLQSAACYDAIAFNVDLARWPNLRAEYATLLYRLSVNEFRGIKQIQLVVEYME